MLTMRSTKTWLAGVAALAAGLAAAPTASAASPAELSRAAFAPAAKALTPGSSRPRVAPERFAAYRVDTAKLQETLRAAPKLRDAGSSLTISLPTPEGRFARFAVRETSVMEPALAAKHPEIRTYAGRSLDVVGSEVHLELTPLGLTAAVRGGGGGAYYVDPRFVGDARTHVVYERDALADPRPETDFVERELGDAFRRKAATEKDAQRANEPITIKTYRLALISDPSYAQTNGANGNTTAAKAVLMDRVNQLYEQDLAIHMTLVAATDKLNLDTAALATGANGPCGGDACYFEEELAGCDGALLDRNDAVAGLLVGARNYDIGHIILGKNGGGIAGLGVVGTESKAQGCTGIPRPVGDYFAIDYVAHEMGHEFGGNHTFAGDQLNCSAGNRNTLTGVEPGSGSTIMAYAGICDQDNLQKHSDPYFSQRSIDEIQTQAATAEDPLDSVQETAFRRLDGSDSYKLSYDGRETTPLTAASSASAIQAAIAKVLPAGGTVTVDPDPNSDPTGTGAFSDTVAATGYTFTLGGTLAGKQPSLLVATGFTGDASGFVGERVAGGPSTKGGSTKTPTTNRAPTVTAPPATTIPVRTPFTLTAKGSDPDPTDTGITYLWEQNDTSPVSDPFLGAGQGTLLVSNAKSAGPLFRVFGLAARYPEANVYLSPSPGENQATGNPTRDLPDVQQVMADNTNAVTGNCPTVAPSQYAPTGELVSQGEPVSDTVADCYSEFLPTASYSGDGSNAMHFRVTARDNRIGMGGVAHADTTLTLARNAGPFRITAPAKNQVVGIGSALPVTWDVAGTDAAPVSTANVRILLSTDAGATWGTVLAASTPNDGTETVKLPAGLSTEQGRIRIEALGNVFYDASRGNLSIVDSSQPPAAPGHGDVRPSGSGRPRPGRTGTGHERHPGPGRPERASRHGRHGEADRVAALLPGQRLAADRPARPAAPPADRVVRPAQLHGHGLRLPAGDQPEDGQDVPPDAQAQDPPAQAGRVGRLRAAPDGGPAPHDQAREARARRADDLERRRAALLHLPAERGLRLSPR